MDNTQCEHDFENIRSCRKSALLSKMCVPEVSHHRFGAPREFVVIKICLLCGLVIDEIEEFINSATVKLDDYQFVKDSTHLRQIYAENMYRKQKLLK